MDGGAWWAEVHGVAKSRKRLSNFIFTFHFHALEKEMATHPSVLAWRIPGTGEPGGLPSMGSHRVRHDWSDLAAAAARFRRLPPPSLYFHSLLPTTLPLLSEVSLLNSRQVSPVTSLHLDDTNSPSPKRNWSFSISEQGLKGISQACHFQRISLLGFEGTARGGTVSRGRCQLRKDSQRPCQYDFQAFFFFLNSKKAFKIA